jgi:hypothetical protein
LLLRASGQTYNKAYELATVTGTVDGDGGVPHGRLLVTFAEAVLGDDDGALARARKALVEALGPSGLTDAAGVVGLFNGRRANLVVRRKRVIAIIEPSGRLLRRCAPRNDSFCDRAA